MSSQLTRRDFVQGASGGAASLVAFGAIQMNPAAEASGFTALADRWRDVTQHYFNVVRSGVSGAAFLSARHAAAQASIRLLDAAAASPRDVLIKYYVLYKAVHFTSFDIDFSESRFISWCEDVEREADAFDVRVPPFWWRWWCVSPGGVSNERKKAAADWSQVRPWEIKR